MRRFLQHHSRMHHLLLNILERTAIWFTAILVNHIAPFFAINSIAVLSFFFSLSNFIFFIHNYVAQIAILFKKEIFSFIRIIRRLQQQQQKCIKFVGWVDWLPRPDTFACNNILEFLCFVHPLPGLPFFQIPFGKIYIKFLKIWWKHIIRDLLLSER